MFFFLCVFFLMAYALVIEGQGFAVEARGGGGQGGVTFRTGSEMGCYWMLQRLRRVSRG